MSKIVIALCILVVAMAAPAPQQLPQVPGLEAYLQALAQHRAAEERVEAAAKLFPPNPVGIVGATGNIGPSGIVGPSGNIGPSGLCGPSGCVAFRR